MNLVKIYNILKIGQDFLSIVIPFLETLIKRDINNNGEIGR